MKKLLCLLLSVSAFAAFAIEPPDNPYNMIAGTADLKSAGAMTIGPDGVLFVADSKGATIFALDLKDNQVDTVSTALELKNIDKAIASFLGVNAEDVVINDLVVNPASQNVYLSVSRGRSVDAIPALIKVNRKGELSQVKTDNVLYSKADLSNMPGPNDKTSWGASKQPMAITDLNFYEGEIYVSGLSTEQFESNLRRVSFPFKNQAMTSVEIFHTSHNRYETNSPITTMIMLKLNNQPTVVAGYGCAPLAKFSLADIKGKKHVKGETLAELGGGSRPVDMLSFNRAGTDMLIIANSNRSVYTMKIADLEKSQPLTTAVDDIFVSSGTPYVATAYVGVMQMDNLNKKHVVAIQRDIQTGALNLVSIQKRWL
jgi:hypothetical protein